MRARSKWWPVGSAILATATVAACTATTVTRPPRGKIDVVAAESFWGSVAAQLGGDHVAVTSIITNPDTDPHEYEPTPQDGRAIAAAHYVIYNGLGYDGWVREATDANPATDRRVLDIGRLLRLHDGDNPHRWYFPDDVERVIAQITQDYKTIDPGDAAYFDEQRAAFESTALRDYKRLVADIKQRFAGTAIGASESIVVGLALATGLNLLTPARFLTAISEGTDPTAQDKATVDSQITEKRIKVLVYNSQNATPDVQALIDEARANAIEVTTITETPPENVSFEDWQVDQLRRLSDALAQATGR